LTLETYLFISLKIPVFLGPSAASSGMHLQVSYPGNLSLRGKLFKQSNFIVLL